jgi:hypothetical protein
MPIKEQRVSWVLWHTPVVPVFWEAKVGGLLKPRNVENSLDNTVRSLLRQKAKKAKNTNFFVSYDLIFILCPISQVEV